MKKLLFLMLFAFSLSASAQSAKVVIEPDGNRSIYLGENRTQYHVSAQDDAWISKRGCRVVTVSAAKGQGYIEAKTTGPKKVYQSPSTKSKVIARIGTVDGMLDNQYRCLGVVNGWYKLRTGHGKVGYVLRSQFQWSPIQY